MKAPGGKGLSDEDLDAYMGRTVFSDKQLGELADLVAVRLLDHLAARLSGKTEPRKISETTLEQEIEASIKELGRGI